MRTKANNPMRRMLAILLSLTMIAGTFAAGTTVSFAAGESGIAYVGFQEVTTSTAKAFPAGTKLFFLPTSAGTTTLKSTDCLLALPNGSATVTVHSGTNTADNYCSKGGFTAGTAVAYVDIATRGTGFDSCSKGAFYKSGSYYYYYCNGSGVQKLQGKLYKYETGTYTTSNIKVTTKGSTRFPLSGTVTKSQLNVAVTVNGQTYTLPDERYDLTDAVYDYTKGDNTIGIKFGSVPATMALDIRAEEPTPQITMSAVRQSGKTTEPLTIGEKINYTMVVENVRAGSLWKDITFDNPIPTGLTLDTSSVKITAAGGAQNPSNISYQKNGKDYLTATLGAYLTTGQSYTITYTATVNGYAVDPMADSKTANLLNTAKADGRGSDGKAFAKAESIMVTGGEKVIPNNAGDDSVKVGSTVENKTDSTPNAPTQAYDELGYTIDIKNEEIGSVWTDVTLTDAVPTGVELKPGSIVIEKTCADGSKVLIPVKDEDVYNPETREIEYHVGDVYGGEAYKITFDVEVTPDAIKEKEGEGEDIGNTIKVKGNSGDTDTEVEKQIDDLYPVGTDKQVVLPGDPQSYMETTAKNLNRDLAQTRVNDVIKYEIAAGNKREHTVWVDVSVHDVVPEGLDVDLSTLALKCPDGTTLPLDPAVYNPQTREISVYLGDIEGNEEYVLSFEAKVSKEAIGKDIGTETWAEGEKPVIANIITETPADPEETPSDNPGGTAGDEESGETTPAAPLKPGAPYFPTGEEGTGSEVATAPSVPVSSGDVIVEKTQNKVYPSAADDPTATTIETPSGGNTGNNPSGEPSGDTQLKQVKNPGILPVDPDPKMEVKVVNEDRSSLKAKDGDTLRYEVTLYNAENGGTGSYLENASIKAEIPAGLNLEEDSIVLKKTDEEGNVTETELRAADVFNPETGELNVPVGTLNEGEVYELTFKATVDKEEVAAKEGIMTKVTAGGEKPDGEKDTMTSGSLVQMQKPLLILDTEGLGEEPKQPEDLVPNIDVNGDGKADLNIDTNGDGIPDINLDTNGDGKPDTNIDTNGDGKPDVNVDKNYEDKEDTAGAVAGKDGKSKDKEEVKTDQLPSWEVKTDQLPKVAAAKDDELPAVKEKGDELPAWAPKTGDTADLMNWFVLLGLAVLALSGAALKRKSL